MNSCEAFCPIVDICDQIIKVSVNTERDSGAYSESEYGDYPVPPDEATQKLDAYVAAGEVSKGTHIEGYSNATQRRNQTLRECNANGPKIVRKFKFFGEVSLQCRSALFPDSN